MTIRLSEGARRAAQTIGKSLNQAVRDHLESLVGMAKAGALVQAFEESARATPGRLTGWRFDHDEANARR